MNTTTYQDTDTDVMTDYRPRLLSSSSLEGNTVVNGQGESLGEIKDFMVDLDTGHIAYAVLSFGGFLGMGDKLFAVPFEALRTDTVNERFVLDVPKEKLENAPGFDKNNWPQHGDDSFLNEVYNYYGYGNYRDYNERYYGDYNEGRYMNRYADRDWNSNTDQRETYADRVARSRREGIVNVVDPDRNGV